MQQSVQSFKCVVPAQRSALRGQQRTPSRVAQNRGFTLIEILVALVIFAIGLLGVGALQLNAMKSSRMAGHASEAAALAREYSEIMQTFPDVLVSTQTATSTLFLNAKFDDLPAGTLSDDCLGASVTCNTDQLRDSMLADWAHRANARLPKFRVVVCRDATPFDTSASNYTWTCSDTGTLVVMKLAWAVPTKSAATGETLFSDTLHERPLTVIALNGTTDDYRRVDP